MLRGGIFQEWLHTRVPAGLVGTGHGGAGYIDHTTPPQCWTASFHFWVPYFVATSVFLAHCKLGETHPLPCPLERVSLCPLSKSVQQPRAVEAGVGDNPASLASKILDAPFGILLPVLGTAMGLGYGPAQSAHGARHSMQDAPFKRRPERATATGVL